MLFRKAARLERSFGRIPDIEYYAGDMECIKSYYDSCRAEERDPFYIDDATWNDLDMDRLYQRINTGLSTAGEQYLYYMLRRPMDKQQFSHQERLIDMMGSEQQTRVRLQRILQRIGNYRAVDVGCFMRRTGNSSFWLILYSLLAILLPVSVILTVTCGLTGTFMLIACLIANGLTHELRLHRCEREIKTANYCVSLVTSLNKIRKMKNPELDRYLSGVYPHLDKTKSILRIGSVASPMQNDVMGMLMTVLLIDLITFELLKKRLAKHQDHFSKIHEAIGQIDAAIAIASFRKSMKCRCVPCIDFDAKNAFIHAQQVVHPMMAKPVPNDVQLERPLLITGANASGKSTYLKASVLCALLAQTICTAPAAAYHASAFRLYTSMAITDNLKDGESYYISEIKSLKRILDASDTGWPVLCAIDEVLRGTNTIERIAASAEILKALGRKNVLCLVATHDVELCALAGQEYSLAHFQETITEHDIQFDYQIRPGMAVTRNAINLLRLIGFDSSIVEAAHRRANGYIQTGQWSQHTAQMSD